MPKPSGSSFSKNAGMCTWCSSFSDVHAHTFFSCINMGFMGEASKQPCKRPFQVMLGWTVDFRGHGRNSAVHCPSSAVAWRIQKQGHKISDASFGGNLKILNILSWIWMDLDVGFGPTKRRYDHRVKISLRWSSIWEPVWLDDLFCWKWSNILETLGVDKSTI